MYLEYSRISNFEGFSEIVTNFSVILLDLVGFSHSISYLM